MFMKKTYFTILIIIFSSLISTQTSFANAISPGVSPGNEFTYEIKFFHDSTNQSVIIPEQILDINKTDYFKVSITEVEENEVSIQTTWRFINGTEIEGSGTINLENGVTAGDFWAIIGSNLNAGDRLHPTGIDRVFINDTITRNYGSGGNRETNLIDLTYTYYDDENPSRYYTEFSETYFDKQTGILVELIEKAVFPEPLTTESLSWKLVETNIWVVPEFPSTLILSLFMISSLIGLIIYKKKNKNSTNIFSI
jgi:hypothetical protein